LIGTLPVSGTGGEWTPQSARISGAAGVHDLFFVFRGAAGEELFKFDYWQFSRQALPADRVSAASPAPPAAPAYPAHNPLIWADVPDIAIIRVGKTYYMSSTTMHMSPGLPIMKSTDLVNWRMASYAYETWPTTKPSASKTAKTPTAKAPGPAACVTTTACSMPRPSPPHHGGRTHIYTTRDPERGPWKETSFEPVLHDHSLFFDDDGRVYMVYGGGRITLIELKSDLSGIKPGGVNKVIIENVNALFGTDQGGLKGEGSQLSKINGRYYLFNIASPGKPLGAHRHRPPRRQHRRSLRGSHRAR
jgi:beta-xylosidase